jgi:hypothetical protein
MLWECWKADKSSDSGKCQMYKHFDIWLAKVGRTSARVLLVAPGCFVGFAFFTPWTFSPPF